MNEHPILFSGPMVRAIRAGAKTVTRRVVTPQPAFEQIYQWRGRTIYEGSGRRWFYRGHYLGEVCCNTPAFSEAMAPFSPYGSAGDRLWVRETWASPSKYVIAYQADAECGAYFGDGGGGFVWMPHGYIVEAERMHGHHDRIGCRFGLRGYGGRWRPSIHMPRWASRLSLDIVSVRVERLHAIDDADAIREGVLTLEGGTAAPPRKVFADLWDTINGDRAPWSTNPWVWRVEFERVEVTRV